MMDQTEFEQDLRTALTRIEGGISVINTRITGNQDLVEKDIKHLHSRLTEINNRLDSIDKNKTKEHKEFWEEIDELKSDMSKYQRTLWFIMGVGIGSGGLAGTVASLIIRGG